MHNMKKICCRGTSAVSALTRTAKVIGDEDKNKKKK